MGVFEGLTWLEQAIFGVLRAVDIRCDGYKMGTKFVVLSAN